MLKGLKCILLGLPIYAWAQNVTITGVVKDNDNKPLPFAAITEAQQKKTVQANESGIYKMVLVYDSVYELSARYLGYGEQTMTLKNKNITTTTLIANFTLLIQSRLIDQIEVAGQNDTRIQAGLTQLNPKNAVVLPSAFGDFNKIIALLPGVVSNNELSSTYSVRGGNYDENLIFVNGIEVYRPFLVRSGQQEGLSFVNPQMANSVEFYAGGWPSKYGDKLSSVMNVRYKTPKNWQASAIGGLLGGSVYVGGCNQAQTVRFSAGFRNKTARYLLNTLPTQGTYLPVFNDLQTYTEFDLTKHNSARSQNRNTTLGVLVSYAGNRYTVIPELSETNFGTNEQILKLTVAFAGTEVSKYDTWQNGLKLTHWATDKLKTEFFATAFDSREREYINLEAGYRLCDVEPTANGAGNFNKCAVERGAGTEFRYARNSLRANVYAAENRSYYYYSPKNTLEWGVKYTNEQFFDRLNEYSFIDSLDFVKLTPAFDIVNRLNTHRLAAYAQQTHKIDTFKTLTYGVRIGWWSLNQQFLLSPSVQYSFKPAWKRDVVWRVATGIYRQPPFYRELRNFEGEINPNLKAQSSWHVVVGSDYRFKAWGREFSFTSEYYGKYLWDVIPYDIDNVRLRYYAQNSAIAYATGADFRVSGEFIKGEESWFSLGIMQTQENVQGSNQGWIRRPTDQRVTFACFFQDHLPKNPSVKVFLNFIYGSGLPFGIPNDINRRNLFSIPAYRRADMGFSKVLTFNQKTKGAGRWIRSLMAGIEILNIMGVTNTLSYIWIADFENRRYAIPQTLSQRFLNARVIIEL